MYDSNALLTLAPWLHHRVSASRFVPDLPMDRAVIERLVLQATRAPSAFNLQNWHFVAVRDAAAKARLRAVAYGQQKITDASVVFVICGVTGEHEQVAQRLAPSVADGSLPADVAATWAGWASKAHAHDPVLQRDEAVRSASLAAMTLMLAAQAEGHASCAMSGFDPTGVAREFGLQAAQLPVMLVAVGQAASLDERQKARRPVADVLRIV